MTQELPLIYRRMRAHGIDGLTPRYFLDPDNDANGLSRCAWRNELSTVSSDDI
jgi:hypothetical protein